MTRIVLAVLTVLTGVAMSVPSGAALAHTGQGNATPGNDGWHPWPTDGCSTPGANVNSVAGVFNFRHACVHHDGCYKGFPRNGVPTYWVSRQQCDTWFLYDMQASCRWMFGYLKSTCNSMAYTYYYAVRSAGWWAYTGPWRN